MADGTPIEWTDATWPIVTGCSVVSPGCANCYAMRLAGTRMKHHPSRAGLTVDSKAGPVWNGQVRFNADQLTVPLRWKRPRRIFVAAHGDLFYEGVTDAWLDQIFAVMALSPQHTYQVLAKRPDRMRAYLTTACGRIADVIIRMRRERGDADMVLVPLAHVQPGAQWWPLPNVWLGVSVEDQVRADERIPPLLATPAAVRWISAEPLLGPVDLETAWHGEDSLDSECWGDCAWCKNGHPPMHNCREGRQTEAAWEKGRSGLDWVVAGGESGPGSRPMHPDWARQLRDQCAAAGVPFLFKQWGDWTPGENAQNTLGRTVETADWFDGRWDFQTLTARDCEGMHIDDEPTLYRSGKRASGRKLDGQIHDAFPEARS